MEKNNDLAGKISNGLFDNEYLGKVLDDIREEYIDLQLRMNDTKDEIQNDSVRDKLLVLKVLRDYFKEYSNIPNEAIA